VNELRDKFEHEREMIRGRFRNEWQMLKTMKGAVRRQHIFAYYKFHMVIMAIILFLIGHTVFRMLNPLPESVLTIAWVGPSGSVLEDHLEDLAYKLSAIFADEDEREVVEVIPFIYMGRPEFDSTLNSRLTALITAADIDIVISTVAVDNNMEVFSDMAPFWAFQNIEPFLEYAGLPRENVIYFVEGNLDPLPCAVFLRESTFLSQFGIPTQNLFFAVVANTRREDTVVEAMRLFFGRS